MALWYYENHSKDVKFCIGVTEHILSCHSEFQRIDFYKSETYGTFFTLDGYLMFTEKDEFIYHEMMVHPAFCVNPSIKNVLIIGGGDGGTAREVCRYPHVEKIHMVEIDELVVRLCEKYLPVSAGILSTDRRIDLFFEDGISFVKRGTPGFYDLILVDSTDPIGPGEGLFTASFYRDCLSLLSKRGILINQHESAFYRDEAEIMEKTHRKIKGVFPITRVYDFHMPSYASGHWFFGFASTVLDPVKDAKPDEWESLGLKTRYYNRDLHGASFCLPQYVKDMLEGRV